MGPDTNTAHFSIMMGPAPHLDGHYTIFGQVVSGFEVREARQGAGMSCLCNGSHGSNTPPLCMLHAWNPGTNEHTLMACPPLLHVACALRNGR
jgi:cyclophilin family peptidyl-prolyl cis-trans isomerase